VPAGVAATRTLVVTNEFPTRRGPISTFVRSLVGLLPSTDVVVYAASMAHDAAYDASMPFPVLRDPARTLLPTKKVREGVVDAFAAYGCDRVLFGAAAPLGLLAPALREAGARRIVGLTHGADWWAHVPAARQVLARIGDTTDALTYLETGSRSVISSALSPAAARRLQRLTPGIDMAVFNPGNGGAAVRRRFGIGPADQVIVCVAPLDVGQGQDALVRMFSRVLAAVPTAWLLLVGGGRRGRELADTARALGVAARVVLTGPVGWANLAPYLDAADVVVRPGRARATGVEPEPFDLAVLAAQSTGVPVVVANPGGRSDLVRTGETGFVVQRRDLGLLLETMVELLRAPDRATAMGRAGREWVERAWSWDRVRERLDALLDR
jgi:phosphatidylinositol alpha-1,6-mannosyltransferase